MVVGEGSSVDEGWEEKKGSGLVGIGIWAVVVVVSVSVKEVGGGFSGWL